MVKTRSFYVYDGRRPRGATVRRRRRASSPDAVGARRTRTGGGPRRSGRAGYGPTTGFLATIQAGRYRGICPAGPRPRYSCNLSCKEVSPPPPGQMRPSGDRKTPVPSRVPADSPDMPGPTDVAPSCIDTTHQSIEHVSAYRMLERESRPEPSQRLVSGSRGPPNGTAERGALCHEAACVHETLLPNVARLTQHAWLSRPSAPTHRTPA
jgi:hypothetical protein